MDRAALRIIDANANRASEGARVLEDAARLGMGDAALAARCKALRHGLRAALSGIDGLELLVSRDTPRDVGTRMTGAMEGERAGMAEVCSAAGKRMGEALRVLEETVKLVGNGGGVAAGAIKALRYEGYELEKRIVLAVSRPRRQWRLCVLITEALCTKLGWDEVAQRAIRGGADCVQLREKELAGREVLARARWLVEIAAETQVGGNPARLRADVIINDRPDIAVMSGAAGVHLGQEDVGVEDARQVLGARMLVGVSTSRLEEAQRAFAEGADYIGLGPMFASTTKAKPRLAGPEYLHEFLEWDRARTRNIGGEPLPHLAISGIDPARAGHLASAGCAGVAVSSEVCSSAEPERVCAAIVQAMREHQA
jgi:thiamine-phosphate pyrophosphorylase